MHWLDVKVPPLLVGMVFAAGMSGVARVAPGLAYHLPGRSGLASALAVLGVAVAMAGVAVFRRRRTTVSPFTPGAASSVVAAGVYRFSRNPMYLGMLLALAGWATHLANAGAFLLLPAFCAYMNQFQIKPEERALLAKFGPEYTQYTARVRRWL